MWRDTLALIRVRSISIPLTAAGTSPLAATPTPYQNSLNPSTKGRDYDWTNHSFMERLCRLSSFLRTKQYTH